MVLVTYFLPFVADFVLEYQEQDKGFVSILWVR